jgi:hypothetical protein
MDPNFAAALATIAPALPKITALGACIAELREKAKADVTMAVARGQKVDRVEPYAAGEPGVWMVVGVPVDYYNRMELTLRCDDAELLEMFRIALAEPAFLGVDNVVDGGPGTLCCIIPCESEGITRHYKPILDA